MISQLPAAQPTLTHLRSMLIDAGRPLVLRPYQVKCVDALEKRNLICALPVGSGKTVIGAEATQRTLAKHNNKKVVFLVPYRQLAKQLSFDCCCGKSIGCIRVKM